MGAEWGSTPTKFHPGVGCLWDPEGNAIRARGTERLGVTHRSLPGQLIWVEGSVVEGETRGSEGSRWQLAIVRHCISKQLTILVSKGPNLLASKAYW
jgi:hypothetical protein